MGKLTALVIQIVLVFGIISAYECKDLQENPFAEDKDAIKFEGENYSPQANRYEDKDDEANVVEVDNRHIIDPPPRPICGPCYKADLHGRCRKILGCGF